MLWPPFYNCSYDEWLNDGFDHPKMAKPGLDRMGVHQLVSWVAGWSWGITKKNRGYTNDMVVSSAIGNPQVMVGLIIVSGWYKGWFGLSSYRELQSYGWFIPLTMINVIRMIL